MGGKNRKKIEKIEKQIDRNSWSRNSWSLRQSVVLQGQGEKHLRKEGTVNTEGAGIKNEDKRVKHREN